VTISLQERANLIILHSTPNRHYHNWNHVEQCYRVANEIYNGNIPKEIEFAICYHDSIYDPYSKTNEEDSAMLFLREHAVTNGEWFDKDLVVSCILNTKNHFADTNAVKNKEIIDTFLDIDLSIFGTEREYYINRYSNVIESEYYATPGTVYREARKTFLENVLKSNRIYKAKLMQKYEEKARENIRNEIYQIGRWPYS